MGSDTHEAEKMGLRRPRGAHVVASGVADWMNCDAALLQKVISVAGAKKCALRFGYSRDGGAYAIGVYGPGDYFTDYIRPDEDIDGYFKELLASLDDFEGQAGPESGKQRRKRQ